MVYLDISDNHFSSDQVFKYKASLMDRFFAFLIDYLIFSPFISFALFLLFQDAIRYWRQNPTAPEQTAITCLLGLCYVGLFSALQSVFIAVWRATPGQYFLKIQIHFEYNENMIFWRAFCRQFGFWLSLFFFGIPWLALMAHPQQKTFYDRLADARVFSKKQSSQFFGFEIENRFWQSFMATMMIFVGLIFFSVVMIQYRDITDRTQSFKQADQQNHFCSELKGVKSSSRLQLAIAMNLIGQLSDDCLDREADFVLWKQKDSDLGLAYYAKSLTESDSSKEKKYLSEICALGNEDGMACRLTKAFESADFETLYGYLKKQDSVLATTLTYEFGLILGKDLDRQKNFDKISEFDSTKIMKKYLLTELISATPESNQRKPASEDEQSDREDQVLELIKDL